MSALERRNHMCIETLLNVHWALEIVCFQIFFFFFFNEFTFEVTDLFEISRKVSLLG